MTTTLCKFVSKFWEQGTPYKPKKKSDTELLKMNKSQSQHISNLEYPKSHEFPYPSYSTVFPSPTSSKQFLQVVLSILFSVISYNTCLSQLAIVIKNRLAD